MPGADGVSLSGINQEALLCLKKGDDWGACDDYEAFVDALVKQENDKKALSVVSNGSPTEDVQKLKVRAFFSESDIMIGKGGQRFFEKCWQREGVVDAIDFRSISVPDTNHDSVTSPSKGGLIQIINELKLRL